MLSLKCFWHHRKPNRIHHCYWLSGTTQQRVEDNQLITYSFLNRGKVVFSHSLYNKLYDSRPGHSTKHKNFQSLFEENDNKIMVIEKVFFYFNWVERLVAECPKSLHSFPARPFLTVYICMFYLSHPFQWFGVNADSWLFLFQYILWQIIANCYSFWARC